MLATAEQGFAVIGLLVGVGITVGLALWAYFVATERGRTGCWALVALLNPFIALWVISILRNRPPVGEAAVRLAAEQAKIEAQIAEDIATHKIDECPSCGFINEHGVLDCRKCGSPIRLSLVA
jgi:hypothetical protein